jgi:hypothetical protein
MSFDLGVWYSDVSLTNEEAGEIYVKLCQNKLTLGGESEAVKGFYTDLTARWPEIDTVPIEVDDVDYCPWSCTLDRSGMHVIMPCVWSKAEDVFAFVHELATKHSLVLFDPQAGEVHLPAHLKQKRSGFRLW